MNGQTGRKYGGKHRRRSRSTQGSSRRRAGVFLAVQNRRTDRSQTDDSLQRTALAYVCDYTILEPLLRVNGLNWSSPGLATASLDHSMWFHRDGRVDDWVLYAQEAVSGQSNRGLAMGRFFDRQGRLLATVAQEGMIRAGA